MCASKGLSRHWLKLDCPLYSICVTVGVLLQFSGSQFSLYSGAQNRTYYSSCLLGWLWRWQGLIKAEGTSVPGLWYILSKFSCYVRVYIGKWTRNVIRMEEVTQVIQTGSNINLLQRLMLWWKSSDNWQIHIQNREANLVVQMVKNLPAMLDPWVRKIPWRSECLPTPAFLPGESHGQKSLVDYSAWGQKELDMTEWLTLSTLQRTSTLFFFYFF